MKSKFLWTTGLILRLGFGIFVLCGFVHCSDEESSGESDPAASEGEDSDEETFDEDLETELEGECDVPNLTRLCCNGMAVQVCTQDREWSVCDCDEDQRDDAFLEELINEEEATNTTPEGNLLSDISFEWDESLIDYALCMPGKYSGSWKCTRQGMNFKGPVTMTLKESVNGEFLEIADGVLTGKAINGIVNFTSTLAGGLDRIKNEFTAEAVDGKYTSAMMPNGKFSGTLTGECVDGEISISGEWSLTDGMTNVACKGPWLIELVNENMSQ